MTTTAANPSPVLDALRPTAKAMPISGIMKVFNHGRYKEGLIPLWAGEGDLPTPAFIADAAAKSLQKGETFYTANRGIPDLRAALARYFTRVYGQPFSHEEFFVTCGGMQAVQLAVQATVSAGEEVLIPTPAWPNFGGALSIHGATVKAVPMTLEKDGWQLSLDRLFAAAGPKTRAIIINSPANPTGWTANRTQLKAILEFARAKGLWIIADEIYGRFYFKGEGEAAAVAPSFLEFRRPDDRIIFVNTFSKNWAMTGWRLGWLQAPVEIGHVIESLIQYNTSGVPTFHQRAGIVALEDGEPFLSEQLVRARRGRDIVQTALSKFNSVRSIAPDGAFYSFFAIDGMTDSMKSAFQLIDEAGVGLAPGIAFGQSAEGHFRICFLRSAAPLEDAMTRLTGWLQSR
jgi:aspartate/methionine/tyrosine aminotransferase